MKASIVIPAGATKADIATWARRQFARLGKPADPCLHDDNVIGILALYLVLDGQASLALQAAEQSGLTDIAAAVQRNMAARGA